MLTNDVYAPRSTLYFDSNATAQGSGSAVDPYNDWADLLTFVNANPSTEYSVAVQAGSHTNVTYAPNLSVVGLGSANVIRVTNEVIYSDPSGYQGETSNLTFEQSVTFDADNNYKMQFDGIAFDNGLTFGCRLTDPTNYVRFNACTFQGSVETNLKAPRIAISNCIITPQANEPLIIQNDGALIGQNIDCVMNTCVIGAEVQVIADTGNVTVTITDCSLPPTFSIVTNSIGTGTALVVFDDVTYIQAVNLGVDLTGVNYVVLSSFIQSFVGTARYFDVNAPDGGDGGSGREYNAWADVVSLADANPSLDFTIWLSSAEIPDVTIRENVSMRAQGSDENTSVVVANAYTGDHEGSFRDVTFTDYFNFGNATSNLQTAFENVSFKQGIHAISNTSGQLTFNNCTMLANATNNVLDVDNGIYRGCTFGGGDSTIFTTASRSQPSVDSVQLFDCSLESNSIQFLCQSFKTMNITMTSCRFNTSSVTFELPANANIALTVDAMSEDALINAGADLIQTGLTVIRLNTYPPYLYEYNDSAPSTSSTTTQANNDTAPTNWVTCKSWFVPDVQPSGIYELTVNWSYSLNSTGKRAFFQLLINGAPYDPFYRKEPKESDDLVYESLTLALDLATTQQNQFLFQMLIEGAGGGTPTLTVDKMTFIFERKG